VVDVVAGVAVDAELGAAVVVVEDQVEHVAHFDPAGGAGVAEAANRAAQLVDGAVQHHGAGAVDRGWREISA